jgi:hypothetical protein
VGPDLAHVPEHRVEAVVGAVARLIDVVCQPGEAPGKAGGDHEHLACLSEQCPYRRRKLIGVGDRGVGNHQQSLNRRF